MVFYCYVLSVPTETVSSIALTTVPTASITSPTNRTLRVVPESAVNSTFNSRS